MPRTKVLLISSILPAPTRGGQLCLYRHLVNQPHLDLEEYGTEPRKYRGLSSWVRRCMGHLAKTPLRRFVEDFWVLWEGRWLDHLLPKTIDSADRTLVMTMAHGDAFMAALRFAKKKRLPLITFFHDWWPHMADVHRPIRHILDAQFSALARGSAISLCVGSGMKAALPESSRSVVLYPIPEKRVASFAARSDEDGAAKEGPFRMVYSGNLDVYGPMIGEAADICADHNRVEFLVRGSKPSWPTGLTERLRKEGRLLDPAPREEFGSWLQDADAHLVVMSFASQDRKRMETSFPSKLLEFAQYERPLVIWGPEYCSAVRWATERNSGLCITDADPKSLVAAVEKLSQSPYEISRLALAAKNAANGDFEPTAIQLKFRELLEIALQSSGPK